MRTSQMKSFLSLSATLAVYIILGCTSGHALTNADAMEERFTEAAAAYDRNEMFESITGYTQLIENGVSTPEVFFNLGNAHFRNGQPGLAVLHYIRARYLAPRDPDVRANLEHVRELAGLEEPESGQLPSFFGSLSHKEWSTMCFISFWIGCLALTIGFIRSNLLSIGIKVASAAGLLLFLSLLGVNAWRIQYATNRAVVIAPDQEALFAPLDDATSHFTVPEGSVVEIISSNGAWIQIRQHQVEGWIRNNVTKSIYPWHSSNNAYKLNPPSTQKNEWL